MAPFAQFKVGVVAEVVEKVCKRSRWDVGLLEVEAAATAERWAMKMDGAASVDVGGGCEEMRCKK